MARDKFPAQANSLDALCRRFGVDNSQRTKHGALLDAELLAEVYLELIGGRQQGLHLAEEGASKPVAQSTGEWQKLPPRPTALPSRLTEQEREQHKKFVEQALEKSLWD